MGTYFLDTSAIVKRYVPERGQVRIMTLCDPAQGNDIYISQAALVEVVATICKKARERSISITDRNQLIDIFRQDIQNAYGIWLVNTSIYTFAGDLCLSHGLRAYDAVQLACALDLRNEALIDEEPSPTFVCADFDLINIAAAHELNVENPNNYSDASQG
jgi:uncharacterized protein